MLKPYDETYIPEPRFDATLPADFDLFAALSTEAQGEREESAEVQARAIQES